MVNFYKTPVSLAERYGTQFRLYAKHFASSDKRDLEQRFWTGRWHKAKPPLLLRFYEATRNHFEVALPLLQKHGLTGWFFVIPGAIATPPAEQPAFADAHDIGLVPNEYEGERVALSWDEV